MATLKVKDGGVAKTMTIVSVSDVNAMFDIIYPVGSYAFGVMPALGTWEEVEGDRALWLKNTVDDGTTIAQALPNIKGTVNVFMTNGEASNASVSLSVANGAFALVKSTTRSYAKSMAGVNQSFSNNSGFSLNANSSSDIYKDGANVQPNAYVMKVYKRVA